MASQAELQSQVTSGGEVIQQNGRFLDPDLAVISPRGVAV